MLDGAQEGTEPERRPRRATSIWKHFAILPDPRIDRTKLPKLEDTIGDRCKDDAD